MLFPSCLPYRCWYTLLPLLLLLPLSPTLLHPPRQTHLPQPLSVQLGPGILGNIFDGIQRPLKAIAQRSGDVFIPRGVAVPALDETASWEFAPTTFKVGLRWGGGLWRHTAHTTPHGRHKNMAAAAAAGEQRGGGHVLSINSQ